MLWLSILLAATPGPVGSYSVSYDAAWAQGLRPGEVARLPSGTYAGPWHLGPGVHLVALAGAILEARQSGAPALVIEGSGVTVEGLAVRAAAGAIGIEATDCAKLTLLDVHVAGGTRGLEVHGGDISWTGGSVEGTSDYGVWAKEAHLSLRDVRLRDNHGPALYVVETQTELTHCSLATSEYGILGTRAQVDIVESDFSKLKRAGLGLTRSSGRLARSHFSGPFLESAISILAAPTFRVEGNRIEQPGSAGIKLLGSTASLEGNVVSGARSDKGGLEGDGLYFYNSRVESRGDVMRDNGGTGVTVLGGAATLTDCRIEQTGQAAAYVADHGSIALVGCVLEGGSTEVVVEPGSRSRVERTRIGTPPDAGR